jgi:hypothetical protein
MTPPKAARAARRASGRDPQESVRPGKPHDFPATMHRHSAQGRTPARQPLQSADGWESLAAVAARILRKMEGASE